MHFPSVLYRKTGELSNAVVAMVLVRIENCWADADWFDYRNFPIATFQANRFHPLGKDRFEAEGRLTLKG